MSKIILTLFLVFQPSPGFSDYPANETFRGRPAPVRLDTRGARMFRTRLIEGAKTGPNFAGHYTVVLWGCGTGCYQIAIVDARTGKVYFPGFSVHCQTFTEDNPGFRLNSRLFIVKGDLNESGNSGVFYYVMERGRLRLIRSITPVPLGARFWMPQVNDPLMLPSVMLSP